MLDSNLLQQIANPRTMDITKALSTAAEMQKSQAYSDAAYAQTELAKSAEARASKSAYEQTELAKSAEARASKSAKAIEDKELVKELMYDFAMAFKLGPGPDQEKILQLMVKKAPADSGVPVVVNNVLNTPPGRDRDAVFLRVLEEAQKAGIIGNSPTTSMQQQEIGAKETAAKASALKAVTDANKPVKTAEQIEREIKVKERETETAAGTLALKQAGGDKPTAEKVVELANQESIRTTGKPLTPGEQVDKYFEYKRPQADETYTTKAAAKAAELAFTEKISNAAKMGERLAEISTEAALLEAQGIETPAAKKQYAQSKVSGALAQIAKAYTELDNKEAVVNTDRSILKNAMASLGASAPGQYVQKLLGTEAQSIRNTIRNTQPLLINYIRQASEMGARGLDSENELKFYLQATTDTTRDLRSNVAAVVLLDESYGTGNIAKALGKLYNKKKVDALRKQGKASTDVGRSVAPTSPTNGFKILRIK